MGPKHVEIRQYINKIEIVTSVGFYSIWLGHVERRAEDNTVQRIKRWKPMSKRPIGRPKTCWEDDVLEDMKNMNVCNWKYRIEIDGRKWLSKPKPCIGCSAL